MSPNMEKAIKQLTADKKKLSIVVVLLAVMLLLWGRLILKKVPKTATAKPAKVTSVEPDKKPEVKVTPKLDTEHVVYVDLPTSMTRDLFAFDPTGYPKSVSDVDDSERNPERKSDSDSSDVDDTADRIKKALRGLTLQTTILGARPRAVINGQVLSPGDTIEGLTVREVHARGVVLELNGRRFKLEM